MSRWNSAFEPLRSPGSVTSPPCTERLTLLDGEVAILVLICDNSHHRSWDDAPFLHHDPAHNLDWYVP
jgi:hypothetical protein